MPLTKNMQLILDTIKLSHPKEISGMSIATWLLKRRGGKDGIREGLKGLERRGLVSMRPVDDPSDEFRQQFPDRMKAMYSLRKESNNAL